MALFQDSMGLYVTLPEEHLRKNKILFLNQSSDCKGIQTGSNSFSLIALSSTVFLLFFRLIFLEMGAFKRVSSSLINLRRLKLRFTTSLKTRVVPALAKIFTVPLWGLLWSYLHSTYGFILVSRMFQQITFCDKDSVFELPVYHSFINVCNRSLCLSFIYSFILPFLYSFHSFIPHSYLH